MKILIISDIHYGKDLNYPDNGGKDYVNSFGSQFEKYLPKFKSLAREHDLLINLGDLIVNIDASHDLDLYKKALNLLNTEKPIKCILGNHELRNLSRTQILKIIGEDKAYYSFDNGNYHHVVLDSFSNNQDEQCRIDPEQLVWLKQDLEKTSLSTLIYCHYILDNQSLDKNYYFKGKPLKAFIKNKKEVRKIFEESKKVIAVFGGHLHFFHQKNIKGIEYITVPSFTENDSNNKPKAECACVDLIDNKVKISIKHLG